MSFLSTVGSGLKQAGSAVWDTTKKGAKNVGENIGISEKAIIEIIDTSKVAKKDPNIQPAANVEGQNNQGGNMPSLDLSKANVDRGMLASITGDNTILDEQIEALEGAERKLFTVQFNPTSLNLTGYSGGLVQKLDYSNPKKPDRPEGKDDKNDEEDNGNPHHGIKRSAAYTIGNTTISLSVSLLFDSCDAQDAFMGDKFNLSPTAVGTGIVKAGLDIAGLRKVTVQKEVEGFIAALRNRYTRLITFHWGDFNYTGELRNVNASYTMFNVVGEPVRATVNLSIMCADRELYPDSLAVWQERYKKAFAKREGFMGKYDGEKGSRNFQKATQSFGNILNL